jgi:hypothetical protein
MTFILGCIHLNDESVRIPEFERLLRPARLQLQIALLQLSGYVVGVETGDSEVVVVEGSGFALLLDSKKAFAYTQDVRLF